MWSLVVAEDFNVRVFVAQTWHPYRPAESAKKNPEHDMLPVLDTQLWAYHPHSNYSSSIIVGHLVWSICHLPTSSQCGPVEGRAQVSKSVHILKRSATVAEHRWVGAKEGHGFGLVPIQRQPFQSRVGMESVELELEVVGSIGSNVICVFTVRYICCLQGCHCPIVRRVQELVHVVCEERVEGSFTFLNFLDTFCWIWVGMCFVTLLGFACVPIPWELRLGIGKSTVDVVTNVACIVLRTKDMSSFYALALKYAIWEGNSGNNLLIFPWLTDILRFGACIWQNQCWGCDLVSLEAGVQITFFISEIVDHPWYFLSDWQSTHLAEGLNLL